MTSSPGRRAHTGGAAWLAAGLLLALAGGTAGAARADNWDVRLRGLLDVVGGPSNQAVQLNVLHSGGSSFDPYRLRLFIEAKPSPNVEIFSQTLVSDETGFYVYGAYASLTPDPQRDLHLQVGKIPWPIGTFGPRTYSNRNPLIGAPLLYQYHTSLPFRQVVPGVDALLSQSGRGQFGVDYTGSGGGFFGMPSSTTRAGTSGRRWWAACGRSSSRWA